MKPQMIVPTSELVPTHLERGMTPFGFGAQ